MEPYAATVLRSYLRDVLEAPGSARANLDRPFLLWQEIVVAPDFNGCLVCSCVAEMSARDPAVADILARSWSKWKLGCAARSSARETRERSAPSWIQKPSREQRKIKAVSGVRHFAKWT